MGQFVAGVWRKTAVGGPTPASETASTKPHFAGTKPVAGSMVMSQVPNPAGQSASPLAPRPPEAMPATRGDIVAVVAELREIRGVLEQIREALQRD